MLTLPSAVPSMGTRRVVFLPAVEDINAIKKTEIDAATSENISCYLTRSGGWQAGGEQATIQDGRYCSVQDFELPGTETRTLMLQYTTNFNEPDDDKARVGLERGTVGVLVHFLQIEPEEDEFTVGDWYEAVPVQMGMQSIMPVEDNAVDRINQKAFIRGRWTDFRQLVA